ncbi:hypothetical protein RZS08_20695, partial [Arthrospira platensis SPKY1]|nr:hypothetical protein [Arthrospira platensis SPKY1]
MVYPPHKPFKTHGSINVLLAALRVRREQWVMTGKAEIHPAAAGSARGHIIGRHHFAVIAYRLITEHNIVTGFQAAQN